MLGNRLRKRQDQLRKWAARAGIEAFRLYERDIPEFPLVIDWYAGDVVAWLQPRTRDDTPEKAAEHRARCVQEIREGLSLPQGRLFLKTRRRQRHRREGTGEEDVSGQYERIGEAQAVRVVSEQGLKFEVNLSDYLDTGLFLDHRVTRDLVRQRAQGKRVLNLFAYTGSFTCYALAGGAVATTTVDLSNTYQAWTERNMRLNGFEPSRDHRLIAADCVEWLARGPRKREQYDIVVCDPPTFSNSKRMSADSFSIDRDWPALLSNMVPWLSDEATVWFSTNSRGLQFDPAQLPEGYAARDMTERTRALDFAEGQGHRAWLIARQATFDSWRARRGAGRGEPGSAESID
jgi:23S rRNA G2069 N7-methylase RlmK/C1962 C5-methylase RlmI